MGNPIILSVQITQPQPEKPKPRSSSLKKEDVRAIVATELEKLPKVKTVKAPKRVVKAQPKPEPKSNVYKSQKVSARKETFEHIPLRGEAEPGRDNMVLS